MSGRPALVELRSVLKLDGQPFNGYTHLMTNRAIGTFEVKIAPESSDEFIARMSIDKTFKGDLAATSKGQMLSFSTEVQGSAGYVAMERVSGTLDGRDGLSSSSTRGR